MLVLIVCVLDNEFNFGDYDYDKESILDGMIFALSACTAVYLSVFVSAYLVIYRSIYLSVSLL